MAKAKLRKSQNSYNAVTDISPRSVANRQQIRSMANRTVDFNPRNLSQARLVKALENNDNHIVCALGPAGTGKTYITAKYAVQQLLSKQVERIIITRPTVEAGESLGYLPGLLEEKMNPWLLPIYDVFMENGDINKMEIKSMISQGIIEIAPFQFMRGRTFKNSIIIADEMQNAEKNQVKMLMTRIGEGSKILLTGDLEQSDRRVSKGVSGLEDFLQRLEDRPVSGISVIKFADCDVVRHDIITNILKIYEDD